MESSNPDELVSDTTTVCADCLSEPDIADVIRQRANATKCSFCGREDDEPFASDAEEIAAFVQERVGEEYEDAANSIMYITAEGGYQARTRPGSRKTCS